MGERARNDAPCSDKGINPAYCAALQAKDEKANESKEPEDPKPSGNGGQDQGGPPTSIGGGQGQGNQGQGGPAPAILAIAIVGLLKPGRAGAATNRE